jgi:hypothetical protein
MNRNRKPQPSMLQYERERARARDWLTHNSAPAESVEDCIEKLRTQGFSYRVAFDVASERA